jgi:hypothetical protein
MNKVYKSILILGNVALANLTVNGFLFLVGVEQPSFDNPLPAVLWVVVGVLRFMVLMLREDNESN